jgi:hypothetical protein
VGETKQLQVQVTETRTTYETREGAAIDSVVLECIVIVHVHTLHRSHQLDRLPLRLIDIVAADAERIQRLIAKL